MLIVRVRVIIMRPVQLRLSYMQQVNSDSSSVTKHYHKANFG
jgi:hypothetical protein